MNTETSLVLVKSHTILNAYINLAPKPASDPIMDSVWMKSDIKHGESAARMSYI
jgi:hypothetical protein